MLRLENVTKVYEGGVVAVKDVALDINKGEFVFLVGPSGSGKSTLIRLMMRVDLRLATLLIHLLCPVPG